MTVVTPSLNQAQFIEETLRSVLLQDYPAIDCVVIDGGSTDGTVEILRCYEPWLASWSSKPDRGQSDAINQGFARSSGEYLAWVNADDVLSPGAIQSSVEALLEAPDAAMVYGDMACVDENGRLVTMYHTSQLDAAGILLGGNPVPQPTVVMRRRAFESVGGLDPELHYLMDFDLWLRLAARYSIRYVPGSRARFRLHPQSKTIAQATQFWVEGIEHLGASDELRDRLGVTTVEEGIRRLQVRAAMDFFHAGEPIGFAQHMQEAFGGNRVPWGGLDDLSDRLLHLVIRPQYLCLEDDEAARRLRHLALELGRMDRAVAGGMAEVAAFWSNQRRRPADVAFFGSMALRMAPRRFGNRGLVKLTAASAVNCLRTARRGSSAA